MTYNYDICLLISDLGENVFNIAERCLLSLSFVKVHMHNRF